MGDGYQIIVYLTSPWYYYYNQTPTYQTWPKSIFPLGNIPWKYRNHNILSEFYLAAQPAQPRPNIVSLTILKTSRLAVLRSAPWRPRGGNWQLWWIINKLIKQKWDCFIPQFSPPEFLLIFIKIKVRNFAAQLLLDTLSLISQLNYTSSAQWLWATRVFSIFIFNFTETRKYFLR